MGELRTDLADAGDNRMAATIRELPVADTLLAYPAMLELRPGIGSEADFLDRINSLQRPEGYRLIASFTGDDLHAVAVAGFRLVHHLHWGRAVYCDDLSTRAKYRGRGYASGLLEWMVAEATRLRCNEFHLDSGLAPDRQPAHRLYFRNGMRIASFHFTRGLAPSQ